MISKKIGVPIFLTAVLFGCGPTTPGTTGTVTNALEEGQCLDFGTYQEDLNEAKIGSKLSIKDKAIFEIEGKYEEKVDIIYKINQKTVDLGHLLFIECSYGRSVSKERVQEIVDRFGIGSGAYNTPIKKK